MKQFPDISELPNVLEDAWTKAAQMGWYPTSYMPGRVSKRSLSSQKNLDQRMINKFEKNFSEAKQYLLSQAGDRAHILEAALTFHEQRNFIASIPLFLSQADGVFQERLHSGVFQYKPSKTKTKLEKAFSNQPIAKAYFSLFTLKTQFSKSSSASDTEDKAKAPNRHAILHGDSRHLDYGTYVNSCKSICFLSSVLWLAELYREHD